MKTKPQFYLCDPSRGKTSIIATVYFDRQKFSMTTGLVVKPGNWSKVKQRVKAGDTLAAVINDQLDTIEKNLAAIIAELQEKGHLTAGTIRERYAALKSKPPEALDFLQTYKKWIEEQTFRPLTKINHTKAKNHLEKFAKKLKVTLSFDLLTIITWERFARHLIVGEGMTNDSAWNILKSVKAFVGSAYDKGWHKTEDFKRVSKARIVPKGESNSDQVYLTERELTAVVNYDLSDIPRLARVRDLFAFLCYSGIRYGDSQRLGLEHRQGQSLVFITGKNRSKATVPLLPEALRIWGAYEGKLPTISNQKGNKYLSEVLELVAKKCTSLSDLVTVVRFKGTERDETTMPKYEAIGLHSGKRTYISLSLSRGATLEALAKVTGNTVKTLQQYDVRSAEDAAELVREVWK
jgi:site-specific recombinase XerD